MRIVFSGGGTGGHIYPAIAMADAVKRLRPQTEILFVGAKDKIEMEKVPKAGYPIEGLWISGFHRKLTLRNLLFPVKLMASLVRSYRILSKFKPDAVVGVGGFASGPILEVATRKSIPTLIQEQNSYPGVTNRILSKRVSRICVAYDHMEKYFPSEKIIKLGNPIRKDLFGIEDRRQEALDFFQIGQHKKTVLLFGGSLGARSLNEAVVNNFDLIKANSDVQLIWQVGKLYFNEFKSSNVAQLENVIVKPFLERMDLAYSAADIVICRAGALTISELAVVAKPAILIPSPNVAEDHQTMNASAVVKKNAAILVKDSEANEWMISKALNLLKNEDEMNSLSKNMGSLTLENADERIAKEIILLAEQK